MTIIKRSTRTVRYEPYRRKCNQKSSKYIVQTIDQKIPSIRSHENVRLNNKLFKTSKTVPVFETNRNLLKHSRILPKDEDSQGSRSENEKKIVKIEASRKTRQKFRRMMALAMSIVPSIYSNKFTDCKVLAETLKYIQVSKVVNILLKFYLEYNVSELEYLYWIESDKDVFQAALKDIAEKFNIERVDISSFNNRMRKDWDVAQLRKTVFY